MSVASSSSKIHKSCLLMQKQLCEPNQFCSWRGGTFGGNGTVSFSIARLGCQDGTKLQRRLRIKYEQSMTKPPPGAIPPSVKLSTWGGGGRGVCLSPAGSSAFPFCLRFRARAAMMPVCHRNASTAKHDSPMSRLELPS